MKRTIFTTAAAMLCSTAIMADVNVGNPMALTGPIPDLVAPMAQALGCCSRKRTGRHVRCWRGLQHYPC